MIRALLFMMALLLMHSFPVSASDSKFFIMVRGGGERPTLRIPNGNKANFSGLSYGASFGSRSTSVRGYGGGFIFGLDYMNTNNSANSAAATEKLSGTLFSALARLYALDVYAGMGFLYGNLSLDYTTGGATTKTKYTTYGGRIEVGADFKTGKTFFWAPNVHYDIMNASSPAATGGQRLNNFGAYIGFGVQF